MNDDDDSAPYWMLYDRAIAYIDPMTGEAPPPVTEDPLDFQQWEQSLTNAKDNIQTIASGIASIPGDIEHAASSAWDFVSHIFGDPSGPPPPTAPPILPQQTEFVPTPDPPQTYTGPGASPSWADVWAWQVQTTIAQTTDLQSPTATVGPQVQRAITVAQGQTTKALSGFINQLSDMQLFAATELANRISDTQQVIGALLANQNLTNTQVHNVLDLVVNFALPQLWAETEKLRASIVTEAEGVIKIGQVWTRENIFDPLEQKITAVELNAQTAVDKLRTDVPSIVKPLIDEALAPVLATLAVLSPLVASIKTEVDTCVEPMCQEFGPGSQLANLLKQLLDSGLLALLAGLVFADPNADEAAAEVFARITGPALRAAVTNWLIPLQSDTTDL